MSFTKYSMLVLSMVVLTLALAGCAEDDDEEALISKIGLTKSHNAGLDCMSSSCHSQGGSGEGVFTVAGTVYDDVSSTTVKPNVVVRLYSHPVSDADRALVAEIEVDGNGNFYTTQAIVWGAGLYAMAESDSDMRFMSTEVVEASGACNSCHIGGAGNTERVYVN